MYELVAIDGDIGFNSVDAGAIGGIIAGILSVILVLLISVIMVVVIIAAVVATRYRTIQCHAENQGIVTSSLMS